MEAFGEDVVSETLSTIVRLSLASPVPNQAPRFTKAKVYGRRKKFQDSAGNGFRFKQIVLSVWSVGSFHWCSPPFYPMSHRVRNEANGSDQQAGNIT